MAVDAELLDRLLNLADRLARKGYRAGEQRDGKKALRACQELEAVQYAIMTLRMEARKHGLHNIEPLATPFMGVAAKNDELMGRLRQARSRAREAKT